MRTEIEIQDTLEKALKSKTFTQLDKAARIASIMTLRWVLGVEDDELEANLSEDEQ